ncbi:MAG TPA: hypothetical protein VMY88_00425 [Acidimicrobiales bacterium]|nr:hypothetical protein [Acidimicrobiales bacterium]
MPGEVPYSTETCDECGFDGRDWTAQSVSAEPARLAEAWRSAFDGRSDLDLRTRPKPEVWSAVEYALHDAIHHLDDIEKGLAQSA